MDGAPKPEIYNYDVGGLDEYKYATNIVVSHSPREFYISFLCGRPYERARCVARLIVSEQHAAEIVAVMAQQLEKFRQKKSGPDEGPEGFKFR